MYTSIQSLRLFKAFYICYYLANLSKQVHLNFSGKHSAMLQLMCKDILALHHCSTCLVLPWRPDTPVFTGVTFRVHWRVAHRHRSRVVEHESLQQRFHNVRTFVGEVVALPGVSGNIKQPDVLLWHKTQCVICVSADMRGRHPSTVSCQVHTTCTHLPALRQHHHLLFLGK